jgi:F-box and WD-40 domain protein 1/11
VQQQLTSRPRSRTAPPLSRLSSNNDRYEFSRERGTLSMDYRQPSSGLSAPPLAMSASTSTYYYSLPSSSSLTLPIYPPPSPSTDSALSLDWAHLFRTRMGLEQRWTRDDNSFQPRVSKIFGHSDSVYCLELDSTRIFTGSRDRTIKVWSLRTGALLGTFSGEHNGSVLCLKFEKDWDLDKGDESESRHGKRGFMVSGSSDCTVRVWDVWTERGRQQRGRGEGGGEDESEVRAEVKAVLTGHEGGVLDLRTDDQWIVSWFVVFEESRLVSHD